MKRGWSTVSHWRFHENFHITDFADFRYIEVFEGAEHESGVSFAIGVHLEGLQALTLGASAATGCNIGWE